MTDGGDMEGYWWSMENTVHEMLGQAEKGVRLEELGAGEVLVVWYGMDEYVVLEAGAMPKKDDAGREIEPRRVKLEGERIAKLFGVEEVDAFLRGSVFSVGDRLPIHTGVVSPGMYLELVVSRGENGLSVWSEQYGDTTIVQLGLISSFARYGSREEAQKHLPGSEDARVEGGENSIEKPVDSKMREAKLEKLKEELINKYQQKLGDVGTVGDLLEMVANDVMRKYQVGEGVGMGRTLYKFGWFLSGMPTVGDAIAYYEKELNQVKEQQRGGDWKALALFCTQRALVFEWMAEARNLEG